MKTLQEECILVMTKNLQHPRIGPNVRKMHRSLKTQLLECVIWHDALNDRTNAYILNAEFFHSLVHLRIPKNNVITDYFMNMVAASGCRLQTVSLVVPLIKHEEKWAPLSGKGIRALFANQEELEELKLVWCINFKADVITRIRSDYLRRVDIVGDAVCRCFEHNISLRDKDCFNNGPGSKNWEPCVCGSCAGYTKRCIIIVPIKNQKLFYSKERGLIAPQPKDNKSWCFVMCLTIAG
uniref:Uncharacterized protein n=1 Tax=Romanomermis culicivorax TaxID=13658 RepID=A0A915KUZ6_ROMCU